MPKGRKGHTNNANGVNQHTKKVDAPADTVWLILKQLDSQNQTIIKLLGVLGKSLDDLTKLVETSVGERIEKLRQDFRNGLAMLITSEDTGDAMKIAKDFLFNQARTRKQAT